MCGIGLIFVYSATHGGVGHGEPEDPLLISSDNWLPFGQTTITLANGIGAAFVMMPSLRGQLGWLGVALHFICAFHNHSFLTGKHP